MPVIINLKPYPGAEYFTVKEHRRNFISVSQINALTWQKSAIQKLRLLHRIPESFSTFLILRDELSFFKSIYRTTIVKDNPVLGLDQLATIHQAGRNVLLDLSFSFPLVPDEFSIDAILIDTAASLGIQVDSCFVFTREALIATASSELPARDAYILDNTLSDIADKGMELLHREVNYKSAVLYQLIESCPQLSMVNDKKERSKTIIRARCETSFAERIRKLGYDVGISNDGNETLIMIANYATHSKELMEVFSDRIMAL